MQVFGLLVSPYVRKVHLVAAEKGIAVEALPANPANPSPEFLAASPFRKMPALRHGAFTLPDSTAIATYFDALQPDPPLTSLDPQQKAKAIWFEEFADTIMVSTGGKVLFNRFIGPKLMGIPGDEAAAAQGVIEFQPLFAYLEGAVPASGWLTGETFSIGDIAVASAFRSLGYVGLEPDPAKHPLTAAWYERVKARPSWQVVAGREAAEMARLG